jgi:hypothetical protein
MYSNHIPVNAYIFIGLASMVMAVVTVMDSNSNDTTSENKTNETASASMTSMLPDFTNPIGSTPGNMVEDTQKNGDNTGSMLPDMADSNTTTSETPNENMLGDMFDSNEQQPDGFNPMGDNANSEAGLQQETSGPVNNPLFPQQQGQPQQPGMFGGNKYNKTNKHKTKHNKKTKNHRKK